MLASRFEPDQFKPDQTVLKPDLNWPDQPNQEPFAQKLMHASGTMHLDAKRLLIAVHHKPNNLEQLLSKLGLEVESTPGLARINHSEKRLWIRSTSSEKLDRPFLQRLQSELAGFLDWFGPVYRINNAPGLGHCLCPLPNVLLIRPTNRPADRSADRSATQARDGLSARTRQDRSPSKDSSKDSSQDEGQTLLEMLHHYGLEEVPEKSKYLGDYRYFMIRDLRHTNAHILRDLLRQEPNLIREARLEHMPLLRDDCAIPNDPFFELQWNMLQIQAAGPGRSGWDITTGTETVMVAVIDTGCDLKHPDIRYSEASANLEHLNRAGAPVQGQPHGTSCAGIIAASINNRLGVAGVAGGCRIMSLAREHQTDVELMIGLEFAAQHGARVVNMSFGECLPNKPEPAQSEPAQSEPANLADAPRVWDFTLIDHAIERAVNIHQMVLCAATGNDDAPSIRYPARHPLVMACGATDRRDRRKRKRLGDLRGWGSNYGNTQLTGTQLIDTQLTGTQQTGTQQTGTQFTGSGVCVMAPGVNIPTTATAGLSGPDPDRYHLNFWGTSAATPHVAGLAALLLSRHPTLNGLQVRQIIEKTADKVGGTYRKTPGFPNGTHNEEMGYGRINVLKALNAAEKMLKKMLEKHNKERARVQI
jgi:subtilisin family serine protease